MDTLKKYLYGAFASVMAILAAVAYFFYQKSNALAAKNVELKAQNDLKDSLYRMQALKEQADESDDSYVALRNDLLFSEQSSSKPPEDGSKPEQK